MRYDGKRLVRKNKYLYIFIGKGKFERLHRYVWKKFNGEIPDGYYIHHIDQDKDNYDISNLQLVTPLDHNRIHGNWVMEDGEWVAKPCGACGEVKLLPAFPKDKRYGGFASQCRDCRNKWHRANRKPSKRVADMTDEEREKVKEYSRKREATPERIAYKQEYDKKRPPRKRNPRTREQKDKINTSRRKARRRLEAKSTNKNRSN